MQTILQDRFELRTLLGRGTMGLVWQAWDLQLKRAVAIKIINPERFAGGVDDMKPQDIQARFVREAEVGARLHHAGIPTLYDALLSGSPKDLYMVWELVLGDTLHHKLDRHSGRLPLAKALNVTAQLADILACVHEIPIVHRDLKPSNTLITEDWQVRLLDFGVAARFGADHPRLTRAGELMGTVAYMAPELFQEHVKPAPQGDLYSLGCMTYEMLTGQLPFTGDPAAMMYGHRNAEPAAINDFCPDLPSPVANLIMRMLAKKVADRPESARSIADELFAYRAAPAQPIETTAPGTPTAGAAVPSQPLHIRLVHALVLFDDGNYGQARPLYLQLGAELEQPDALQADEAADCRAKAAYCAMRLGNITQALTEYEALATDLQQREAPAGDLLLDVRLNLGLLQEQTDQLQAAVETLSDIYKRLGASKGSNAPETAEARAALNRLLVKASPAAKKSNTGRT
ncbi:serine/threonine-protein kinase [Streptomyces sp. NBC_00388]|uniref:serine/threonine-protein kinase n=1 Tax=Streptomyces sp. NBC_00388 TaxID=2975735 RepID=UPI002E22DEC6